MNPAASLKKTDPIPQAEPPVVRPFAIIGTGNVGGALLARLRRTLPPGLALHALANSRRMRLSTAPLPPDPAILESPDSEATQLDRLTAHLRQLGPGAAILDLTASETVAARHADWLAAGLSVVTANKWAAAGSPANYQRLVEAGRDSGTIYGDATTVGAGLPVLESLRRLVAAGDRIHAVSGLFSGTLTSVMHGLGDGHKLSDCVRRAHAQGLTEPDPRLDLSGIDVARKLVITARAAGHQPDPAHINIENLVPPELSDLSLEHFFDRLDELDSHWQTLSHNAPAGHVPRYVGEFDRHGDIRVGLQWLKPDHPLVNVGETDNIFHIRSDCYDDTPLIIRGPGAGADVTALQVLVDLLKGNT